MKEKLLNIRQSSEILGIKPKTLYQWSWAKKNLPFIKVGGALRISEEDLFRFIQKNRSNKVKR